MVYLFYKKDSDQSKDINAEEDDEKQIKYWDYVQGHPNPYGKEFFDYVEAHRFIKFSSNPEIARQEMREVNYKMHADLNHEDIRTLSCEKSNFRLMIEMFLNVLDNSI